MRAARRRKVMRHDLWLTAILLLAAGLRALSIAFGLPSLNDQDELTFQMGAVRLLSTPTLNPHWFGHPGTTTIYGLALVDIATYVFGDLVGWWSNAKGFTEAFFSDPTLVILPGRAMILAFGLWTIAITYRIGQRVFSPLVGLVAAVVLAVSPLHVAYSQVIRSDMMATAFMLLSVLLALRAARGDGAMVNFLKAGAWVGVAVATKWPFALGFVAIAGAAILRWRNGDGGVMLLARRMAGSATFLLLALVVTSPFLVLDWHTVVADLHGEARPIHLGATGGSFLWNLGWYLSGPIQTALGTIGLVLVGIGLKLMLANREARFLIMPIVAAFLVLVGGQHLVWSRWILPLLPFLALAIGLAVEECARWLNRNGQGGIAAAVQLGLMVVVLVQPVRASLSDGRERMNDTRQQASRWLMAHAEPGKTVLIEHFGFDLLHAPYAFRWPVGDAGCIDPLSLIRTKASFAQVEGMRGGRSNVDYGTVAENRLDSCRADYAIITQYDRYTAERDRFPHQYAQYAQLVGRSQTLAVFRPQRGVSGGWVVRVLKISPR